MKKIWMSLLALVLALSLIGCGNQIAQSKEDSQIAEQPAEKTAQEKANGDEAEPQAGTAAWRYVLTTEKQTEERRTDAGVLLASTSYELPKLEAICDGGDASQTPPEAQRKVCEAFNSRVAEFSKSLTAVDKLAESAQEQYNEMSEEYRKSFGNYTEELSVSESRQRGDLLEVSFQTDGYWGGAHGGSSFFSWHYDLADGKFIELADLSDQPEKLNQIVADEIISSIGKENDTDGYFEDYAETIRAKDGFEVSFGANAMTVTFSQYEIAPYASGIPSFEISYDKLAPFLNERGRRLLGLGETGVSESESMHMPAWEETEAPVSTHKVEVADQSVTTYQDNNGDEYKTILPKLIVDGKEADSINAALLDYINRNHPLTKNEYGVNGEETRYTWGVRGDIVSIIIIASETFTDGVGYDIFNYNVETLQPASNDEVIKSFGITADEFCSKVADAYRAFWNGRPYLQENMSDLDRSIGAISLSNVTPFITPDGAPGAAGRIYVTGSQFPESVKCFNLDTLEIECFAKE